jgi:NitT/TauT family transport system permease protein
MNAQGSVLLAERAGAAVTPPTAGERRDMSGLALLLANPGPAASHAFSQDRPRLPAPHQVATELWGSTMGLDPTSRRSLVFHAGITLGPTLLGFALGSLAGIALAIGIVYSRVVDRSVMPWAIASQTIPILAIAPMIIVVLNSVGVQGLLPKAIISAYLSFFPVTVGMVKGLRAPSSADLDLMRTWNASATRTLVSLRLPTALPYLFASLKVAVAAALVGTIIGELPTGAVRGLGARLLAGSYYGQTVQIWSALFAAAIVAASLVALVALAERVTLRRMGLAP